MHGSLARAGKVRGQTPKVAKQDKKKKPRGRAHKRLQHNRRFVTAGIYSFFTFCYRIPRSFTVVELGFVSSLLTLLGSS